MTDFLVEYKTIIVIAHALFATIGVGTATVSDIMFFKFMKDGKIDTTETPILDILTRVVWVGIIGLILTGILLYFSNPAGYAASSKFIVKVFIVGLITLNGLFLTLYLHKRMLKINFATKRNRMVKRLGFASGALSIVSWYIVFILGSIRSIPYSVIEGLVGYLIIAASAIAVSQIMYEKYRRKYLVE